VLVHAQLAFAAQSLDIVDGDLVVPDEAGIDLVDSKVAVLAVGQTMASVEFQCPKASL